ISPEQLKWLLDAQEQYLAKHREAQAAAQRQTQADHAAATQGGKSLGTVAPNTTGAPRTAAVPASAPAPAPAHAPPPPRAPTAAGAGAFAAATTAPAPEGSRALDQILMRAVKLNASDVHIHSSAAIQMRIAGTLLAAKGAPLEPAAAEAMILEILT